jgi:hypothetical protein
MTTNNQLELSINGGQRRGSRGGQDERMARAAWWFAHMRRVVAEAADWQAAGRQQGRQTQASGGNTK